MRDAAGQPPGAVRQLAQPGAEHGPHRRGEHRLPSIRGDSGAKRFDDEEWIAFGLAPEPRRQFRIDSVFGTQSGSQRRSRGFVESFERYGGHSGVVAQGLDQSNERMMLWNLLGACGPDDENRYRLGGPDDETDQLDGLGVTPLQIIDDEQTRAVADDDCTAHSVEQPMALSRVARQDHLGRLRGVEELR